MDISGLGYRAIMVSYIHYIATTYKEIHLKLEIQLLFRGQVSDLGDAPLRSIVLTHYVY